VKEGRGASLGGLSTIAYTLVEEIERKGQSVARRFTSGTLARQTALPSFLARDRPLVMGIVNVTPDSFSDGGLNADAERAIAHGRSSRRKAPTFWTWAANRRGPAPRACRRHEEIRRVIPVIEGLVARGHAVSVDTRKASVMRAALKAGARMVNDVSALTHDPQAAEVMAARPAR
jgi:dihydropteroate synthase